MVLPDTRQAIKAAWNSAGNGIIERVCPVESVNLQKKQRHESKHLRDSARGQPCLVRIPGVCNGNPETTILAHTNGGGMGTKKSDLFGAFCCSSCHDVIDGKVRFACDRDMIELWHRQGVERTQQFFLDVGLVVLK